MARQAFWTIRLTHTDSKRYFDCHLWYVKCTIALSNHSYSARLVIGDVQLPLVGADFHRQHNLLVDVRGRRFIEADTYLSASCDVIVTSVSQLAPPKIVSDKYHKVLNDFPEVLQPTFSHSTVNHSVQHYITTTGSQVHARARRLSPDKLTIARNEFAEMEYS